MEKEKVEGAKLVTKKEKGQKQEALPTMYEVFVRSKNGLSHVHVGSVEAAEAALALQFAEHLYVRRAEGVSVWVTPSAQVTASLPENKALFQSSKEQKKYRFPSHYVLPSAVKNM